MRFNLKEVIGESDPKYPAIDKTTPWSEFLFYCECCNSLNVKNQPRIGRYLKYREYLKEVGIL